jgi:hypothetical protein
MPTSLDDVVAVVIRVCVMTPVRLSVMCCPAAQPGTRLRPSTLRGAETLPCRNRLCSRRIEALACSGTISRQFAWEVVENVSRDNPNL